MTARSNLQQVQTVDVDQRDAWYVAESTTDAVVLCIDDHWTTALDTSAISHFANTSTETSRFLDLSADKLSE